ncbi:MAG: hypothetical protein AAF488_14305 [Planctomycetota bacterium]
MLCLCFAIAWGGVLPSALPQNAVGGGVGDDTRVLVGLSQGVGRPGQVVTLDLNLLTDQPLKKLTLALDFDETLLQIERVRPPRDGNINPNAFDIQERRNNDDAERGAQASEGWIYVELTRTQADEVLDVPNGRQVTILHFDFRILDGAEAGFTNIQFRTVFNEEIEQKNVASIRTGADVAPVDRELRAQDTEGGAIEIIGEVGFFVRGDVDLNCRPEITDAIITLRYLFGGGREPPCLDAADANDSGDIDISDSIFTLKWLFDGGLSYVPPFPRIGEDPTEDILDCIEGFDSPGDCSRTAP